MRTAEEIKKIVLEKLNCIDCSNCKFGNIDDDEAEEKYGYYGCEWCHRKNIYWGIRPDAVDEIVKEIVGRD